MQMAGYSREAQRNTSNPVWQDSVSLPCGATVRGGIDGVVPTAGSNSHRDWTGRNHQSGQIKKTRWEERKQEEKAEEDYKIEDCGC